MNLIDEVKTYRIPLEETVKGLSIGEIIDKYTLNLLKAGYYMVYWKEIIETAEYEVQFRKSH